MTTSIATLVRAIDDAFPYAWAEGWDAVGLRVGDPSARIEGVLVSLDATPESIQRAASLGANVLVTHHPPSLGKHETVVAGGAADTIFKAAAAGVAIISSHTNLDRAPEGASVLMKKLGLDSGEPLESASGESRLITLYVPKEHAASVRDAMSAAGAGRVGEYEQCSFTSSGEGRFSARQAARSAVSLDATGKADEERVEALVDPALEGAVVAAARSVHPYEEPVIISGEVMISRGVARLGRVGDLPESLSLASLVERVGQAFDCVPRVWGDPDSVVARLATATGSGSSLVGTAIAVKADALLTGEVRYHDALDALSRGMSIIEAGHDVTEWPLVEVLGDAVRHTPGLDPALVTIDDARRNWWTP